ncbi:hypothetical protein CEXT_588121 [Caerostris extrusa]|uniref:Uncharacterized protein n=1 Tax=Caerostris extrusa TaxID=172846 RepID=A0AAV4XDJ1_CAEEX|nr:hypothetical protein CEXT_588121 [Caerostris extrusa]
MHMSIQKKDIEMLQMHVRNSRVFTNEFKVKKDLLHQNPSNTTSMTQTESDNVYQEGLLQPNKEMGTRAKMPFY